MSTTEKRNRYTDEFKREAVKALIKSGKPVVEMAVILGVEQSILHRWKTKFGPDLVDVPQSSICKSVESDEIHALKTEIADIRATMNHLRNIFQKYIGDKYQLPELEE
jgi:transposase